MLSVFGRACVLLALFAASAGSGAAFVAARTHADAAFRWARRFARAFAAAMIAATAVMEIALLTHDFSVSYVARVGSRTVPVWVSAASLWSSLEGSILLWSFALALYVVLWLDRARAVPDAVFVWLACAAFFSFLLAGPAQPFAAVANPPIEGPGPNPLLQNHVLMAVHPPLLYLGYVGMTIPFGFACAALLAGRLDRDLIRPLRSALLAAWIFLTVAIVLGGLWAYEVLGWGGYWAWDPVENASLMPWLTATAALHSALVTERKGALKAWTATLTLATFLLTILGTFLTRSGMFDSVHAFTRSAIGPALLAFLGVGSLLSTALLALRLDVLGAEAEPSRRLSRDTAIVAQNLLLVLFTFAILLGTVYPVLAQTLRGMQVSVARPYFDRVAVPFGLALLFLMGVGPALPWGGARRALAFPFAAAAAIALVGFLAGVRSLPTLLALFFGGYAAEVAVAQLFATGPRSVGASLAHAGAVVVIVAVAVSGTMQRTSEVVLRPGESATLAPYEVTLAAIDRVVEPHRLSIRARLDVRRDGKEAGTLLPSLAFYQARPEPIGTPAVRMSLGDDLYLSAHHIDERAGVVRLSMMVNPMVAWIWIAGATIAAGAGLAIFAASLRLHAAYGRIDEASTLPDRV